LISPVLNVSLPLEEKIKIISERSDPNTFQPMERSDNEETEELQFDLDYYENEVPNQDHAEIQEEEEEALHNEDLPQKNIPCSPTPNA
jgi:hypothetical protein